MKTPSRVIGFVLLLAAACHSVPEPVTTVISGQIINPKGQIVQFQYGDETQTDTLDAENKFVASFDIQKPVNVTFTHGEEHTTIYLTPGDQLDLSLDTELFDETLTYSGTGAEANRYNAAMYLLMDSPLMGFWEMVRYPEDSFLTSIDSVRDFKLAYLDSFQITDENFKNFIITDTKYETGSYKTLYAMYHGGIAKLDSFEVSKDYFSFWKDFDINDTTQLIYPNFKTYVMVILDYHQNKKMGDGEEQSYCLTRLETIQEVIADQSIREVFAFGLLKRTSSYIKDEDREKALAVWKGMHPSAEHLAVIQELSDRLEKLSPGSPAPDFTAVSVTGDSVSLSDFKGKLVYIDVWATWCGPCKAEHPHMEKLQERFKDAKDLVFVAVSIDSTPEPWKKMVEEKHLGGVQLFIPGAWNSSVNKDYLINGIPRFLLIDKEGKIVDVNAERPSGNIGDQLQELLSQAS